MIRNYATALLLAFGILISSHCCPKDSFGQQIVYNIEGKISKIDTFRSIVTVKVLFLSPVIVYKEISLFVGPNTKITHKGEDADIFDLLMGSSVAARYIDKDGKLEALDIAVTRGI